MTTSNRPWAAKVVGAIGITGALVALAFLFDHPAHPVGTHSGVVMGTYAPGKPRSGMGTMQVELDNGAIVLASIPMLGDFPYAPGTVVEVTAWESLVFGTRSYEARVHAATHEP